jgi:lipocalin-like protein
MKRALIIAVLVLGLTTGSLINLAHAADSIVGTWRLVSWVEEETESKAQHKNFGDNPSGILTYTADGRVSQIFADPKRTAAATPKATDAEAAQLYRSMVAYAGSYKLEGDKILVKIDVAWNRAWDGQDRPPSFFEIKGDRLTIKTSPFVSPFIGKQMVATLVWERVK